MTPDSPLAHYRALVASGALQSDADQLRVATALGALHQELRAYQPPANRSFLRRLFRNNARSEPPKGLYIYGSVGRGKSFLMDLFFDAAQIEKKRRVHFNAFMAETHQWIHEWRNLNLRERKLRPEFVPDAGDDPIAPAAKRILNESWLLCFDEFQINDVADAMIFGRLFEKLFAFGVIVVLTSNTAPDGLYHGGLNRELFRPAIDLMKLQMRLLALDGGHDYRLEKMAGIQIYNTPLGPIADEAMNDAWRKLTDDAEGAPTSLEVFGRAVAVPCAANGVARFHFDALCGRPLGAADYVALARKFHTLLLDQIPKLVESKFSDARRFTLLVDTLYDEGTKLICSAAAAPAHLLDAREGTDWFQRTVSRLAEMQSEDYMRLEPGAQDGNRDAQNF